MAERDNCGGLGMVYALKRRIGYSPTLDTRKYDERHNPIPPS